MGRYGSAVSTQYYSPLYYKYRLYRLYGASPEKSNFITDQWWGWYIGESGILGHDLFFISDPINRLGINQDCEKKTILYRKKFLYSRTPL